MLDFPHEAAEYVSWLIHARRCELGSRRRGLGCFQQALLVLVHLCNETLAQVTARFGVSTTTVGRYVSETVDLLAERAPPLREALYEPPSEGSSTRGGTLIATGRIAADEPHHLMRHRRHGLNAQVVAAQDGTRMRYSLKEGSSRALPGRTHDLTAARAPGAIHACLFRRLLVPADRAHQGAGATVRILCHRHHELPEHCQQYNQDHVRLRAPGERAFARLKQWRILRKARCSTQRPCGCFGPPARPLQRRTASSR
ncbi:transposase family protein [Streptomyces sp. Act-28]